MTRLGTRRSLLARTQSGAVAARLAGLTGRPCDLVVIRADGDDHRIRLDAPPRPGVFVAALRDALLACEVDLVVHSFKDLPSGETPGLTVAAVPGRARPHDVLVTGDGSRLADLAAGARVGTSSPRRAAALLRARPDLLIEPIRGNVDTRLRLVEGGQVDAVVLAAAGLERIGRLRADMEILGVDVMVPAPAQGALAVECRSADPLVDVLAAVEDPVARCEVTAERAVLDGIVAACTTAIGALATWSDGCLELVAELSDHRGVRYCRRYAAVDLADPRDLDGARELGLQVAESLLET